MTGLQHKDDELETPPWVFNQIIEETGLQFNIDLCASNENHLCEKYYTKYTDGLNQNFKDGDVIFCNPPRSKNGKFVTKCMDIWKDKGIDTVILLCWNDLGNKYCDEIRGLILQGVFSISNLGKIKFYKNGIESDYPSRLSYFWVWLKSKP